jgi:osmotically-inducible protein OsmY
MRGTHRLVTALAAVAITIGAVRIQGDAGVVPADTQAVTQKVRNTLSKLPYYGVFDFLAFGVDGGVITLKGYAHRPALKREAEEMVAHAVQADVVNRIEILPTSSFDDRIRWGAFQRVYTDDLASKYVPGGGMEVRYELLDMARFAGMEPYGTYPVHIIVKDRKVLLIGLLDSELDKTQVLLHARQVPHIGGLEDAISVRRP